MFGESRNPVEKEICDLEKSIQDIRNTISGLREKLPAEEVKNYALKKRDGSEITFKDLFGENDEMLLVHNMNSDCSYCTLWADGLKGLWPYLNSRCAFVLENELSPESLDEFANDREWNFPCVSSQNTNLKQELGFKVDDKNMPGVSSLYLKDGKILRHATAPFGPGDDFCSMWHFLGLLKNKNNGWQPRKQK